MANHLDLDMRATLAETHYAEETMYEPRPRASSTTAAAVLMLLICIPFVINGFDLVELIKDPGSASADVKRGLILTGNAAGEKQTRTFAIFGAALMLGLCALTIALAFGILRRRSGSHQAATVIFALLALMALAASLSGLTADPPAENAKLGLLVGLVDVAIVVCLLLPSTQEDVEYAELVRLQRRHEKLFWVN